jgi:putative transposase
LVADITCVRTRQGWLYLTIIMDLFDRMIIGWSMSLNFAARTTVIAAFQMAVKSRPIHPSELIFHVDRDVDYACDAFRKLLKALKIFQSMCRKGDSWDNAVAENFFKILRCKLIYQIPELNVGQARTELFEFIEIW